MRPYCILVYDNERRFELEAKDMQRYLQSIRCTVKVLRINHRVRSKNELRTLIYQAPARRPLFLMYTGHGGKRGWGRRNSYRELAIHLRRLQGPLIVMNDTCYGVHLVPHLLPFRREEKTCFIGPWDGDGTTRGEAVENALRYWPHGQVVENFVRGIVVITPGEEETVSEIRPAQLRWGAQLDHLFFPARVR